MYVAEEIDDGVLPSISFFWFLSTNVLSWSPGMFQETSRTTYTNNTGHITSSFSFQLQWDVSVSTIHSLVPKLERFIEVLTFYLPWAG